MLLGPEFDKDKGIKAIVVSALYGFKSAGAALRSHSADCMRQQSRSRFIDESVYP